ncbi:cytochrome b/b6 domain-containing protein [Candidatus Methylocalor cossyra]|uniref:Cytochrome B561 n=1 Tax=Candidatus Methylocalor cossyra TaxID=3108543 RepID=A0ABP1C654_9GAMM
MSQRILVWDLPTRVFHWSFALTFAGAYLTAESERWQPVHLRLGYTFLILLAFRLVWGLVGTRYARFADFVRGPRATLDYLRGLLQGRPQPYLGHNPAGAVAILSLLLLGAMVALSGWVLDSRWGGEPAEEWHEVAANLMLALVGLHVLGVLVSSWLHRENLVRAMITGRKQGPSAAAIGDAKPWLAWLLLAGLAGFWGWDTPSLSSLPATASGEAVDDD